MLYLMVFTGLLAKTSQLTALLIKKLGLGNATSLPGRLAIILDKQFLHKLLGSFRFTNFRNVITGTNGKTTTTGILKNIYLHTKQTQPLICNDLGANLYYGVATAFAMAYQSKRQDCAYLIEADEAALASICRDIQPKVLGVTNIYRDQLDRFGEINTTLQFIKNGLIKSNADTLVINYDQAILHSLIGLDFVDKVYGIRLRDQYGNSLHIQDEDSDLMKLTDISICYQNKIHLVNVTIIEQSRSTQIFSIEFSPEQKIQISLKIPGVYNIYNAAMAATIAFISNISLEDIQKGISTYSGAFGRAQTIKINEKEVSLYLIKNPTGATEVMKVLARETDDSECIIAINDDYADGRDISWLWDAHFDLLNSYTKKQFICTGHRAFDMANRLKYAGIDSQNILVNEGAIDTIVKFIDSDLSSNKINILATYTALLKLEKQLDLVTSLQD